MGIVRLNELPEGSGNLTNDDIFVFMDDPSGSGITKKISLSEIGSAIGGGGGGNPFDQNLNTTDFPTFSGVNLTNNSSLAEGSFDSGIGGNGGISLNCAVGYELNWQAGHLRNIVTGDNTGTIQTIYYDSPIEFPYNNNINVSLLLHFDNGQDSTSFTDSGPNNYTITSVGGCSQDETNPKFGNSSVLTTGSGQYLTIPGSAFDFGNNDFTIEWYQYVDTVIPGVFGGIFGGNRFPLTGAGFYSFIHPTSGKVIFGATINGAHYSDLLVSNTSPTLSTWEHYAITRYGNLFTLWQNGVAVSQIVKYGAMSPIIWDASLFSISSEGIEACNDGQTINIDEFRVTKNIAIYKSNFSPPETELIFNQPTTDGIIIDNNKIIFPDGSVQKTAATSDVVQLVFNSTINTDASFGDIFDITLTDNITLAAPTNPINGKTLRWRISQDSVGGRSVTLNSIFVIPSSASSPLPWSTSPNSMDILAATYHEGRDKWDIVAFVPGY